MIIRVLRRVQAFKLKTPAAVTHEHVYNIVKDGVTIQVKSTITLQSIAVAETTPDSDVKVVVLPATTSDSSALNPKAEPVNIIAQSTPAQLAKDKTEDKTTKIAEEEEEDDDKEAPTRKKDAEAKRIRRRLKPWVKALLAVEASLASRRHLHIFPKFRCALYEDFDDDYFVESRECRRKQFTAAIEEYSGYSPRAFVQVDFLKRTVYQGRMEDNAPHGVGKMAHRDGTITFGHFTKGVVQGLVRETGPDGSWYYGRLKRGARNGYGRLIYANGDKYEGDFKEGVRHGSGIFVSSKGDKYEGRWEDGVRCGQGTQRFGSHATVRGTFADDRLETGEIKVKGGVWMPL